MSGLLIAWVLMFGAVDEEVYFTVTTDTQEHCVEIQRFVEATPALFVIEPCVIQTTDVVLI